MPGMPGCIIPGIPGCIIWGGPAMGGMGIPIPDMAPRSPDDGDIGGPGEGRMGGRCDIICFHP